MCSCKTQKVASLINEVNKENVQTEWSKFEILVDTTKTFRVDIDKSKLKIIETIKITEYDAESGKPIKETEAKRETTQDSDKVVSEETNQAVTNSNQLEVEHLRESTKKIDSEVKEESQSGLGLFGEQFGKYLGIVMGIALLIGAIYLYLKKKFLLK
jgi:hypothetical protein